MSILTNAAAAAAAFIVRIRNNRLPRLSHGRQTAHSTLLTFAN